MMRTLGLLLICHSAVGFLEFGVWRGSVSSVQSPVKPTRFIPSMSDSPSSSPPLLGNGLVLGGNRGLGLEIVKHLQVNGAKVLATARKSNADLEVNQTEISCPH
ncbi:unnamed protein product [Choristocarpus tenellus]